MYENIRLAGGSGGGWAQKTRNNPVLAPSQPSKKCITKYIIDYKNYQDNLNNTFDRVERTTIQPAQKYGR